MANAFREIDTASWTRAEHCQMFRDHLDPTISVTFETDITNFHSSVKSQELSFTMAMTYALCNCANAIDAFRYRFVDGKIVEFTAADPVVSWLNKDTNLFKLVRIPMVNDLATFCHLAVEKAEAQEHYFPGPPGKDVFMCSGIPWIKFTHMTHANSGKKDNATPWFHWGKFYENNGRILIPVMVQVHHSFADGYHLGLFAQQLQQYMDSF